LLVADLSEQGWQVTVTGADIAVQPPGLDRGQDSVEQVKDRVRQGLQLGRLRQLQEASVRKFLCRVERRTVRNGLKASVLDLVDDGQQLASELERIQSAPIEQRDIALAALIDPVIEVCEAGARCPDTGLPLTDIWRYFRHTWAHEYRPIPGRQLLLLIRNAARPKRPVMGLAMLASPVMRLTSRDRWIGWLREAAEERVATGEWDPAHVSASLIHRIEASIAAVRSDDLATAAEVGEPSEKVILRLEQRAAGAAFARGAQLRAFHERERAAGNESRPHRGDVKAASEDTDWRLASEDMLFVRKRAEGLAELLFAKAAFRDADLASNPAAALEYLFSDRKGRRALDIAFAEFRKAGLSSQVADVSICGAVHPYNPLLVGKLVAMLLTSKEVRDAYSRRYSGQISVIASQMAGRAVSKPADLRILTTTSLYGVGSSQYNRLKLRAIAHADLPFDLSWTDIGKSRTGGFGTLHLSRETAQALQSLAIARHDARRVNNRFGEGTSPRLRQIREGLDALGLESNAILHHATPRLFYGCELMPGARESLLGLTDVETKAPLASAVAAAWRCRWLSNRILRTETVSAVGELGLTSIRAALHADVNGQFLLPVDD
jgi:hypothetical protein